MKYPKILTGLLNLRFRYDVSPISLYSLKPQDFEKPHRQWVLGVKNLVFKKYSKISTGVKNEILIQCRPKIFALFKNPKILTRTSRPSWVLGIKNMVLIKYPKISASAKPKISIRCKPNIFVVFKNPKILTSRTGNGFLVSKTWFL